MGTRQKNAAEPPAEQPRLRRRLEPTEIALFLAMCAVLTIAGAVIVRAMLTGTVPRGVPATPASVDATLPAQVAGIRAQSFGAGIWRDGPPLPTERSEVSAAVVDGTIYVLGGLALDGHTVQTVEALPSGADAWEARAPLPAPRDHLAAVSIDGWLYAIGGSPGWFGQQTSNTVWIYDPGRDAWLDFIAPLPLGRAAHAAAVLGNKIYVVGGIGPDAQRVQVYNPAQNTWELKAPMRRPREHLAAVALQGKLYAIGGRWGDVGNVDLLEEYDPATDTWRTLAPMPRARGGLAASALGTRIFVTGGEVLDDTRATFPQLDVFDAGEGVWTEGPPLPTGRHGLTAVTRDGELYVLAGGRLAGLDVSGAVEVYSPGS